MKKQALALLILPLLLGNDPTFGQIAIVANKEFPLKQLTIIQVREIFMGRRTTFEKGGVIHLAEFLPSSESFCRKGLGISLARYRKHWIKIIFSGGSAAPPKSFDRAEDLKEFLQRHRTAIGFLDWKYVDESIRVIPVDGKNPRDRSYFLAK